MARISPQPKPGTNVIKPFAIADRGVHLCIEFSPRFGMITEFLTVAK